MKFKDKITVITGAAKGIGLATAEYFATEGATVVLVDIDTTAVILAADRITKTGGKGIPKTVDVSNEREVEKLFQEIDEQFGKIDILVNNAAATNVTPFLEVTGKEFDSVVGTNLRSVFLCGQAAAKIMIDRSIEGAIINMSSITAELATPTQAAYGASKGGINSLTKVMAIALAEHGIRVNAIGPGTILTELARSVVMSSESAKRTTLSRIPLRRFGQPREIATVVAFLASSDSSYITGQTLYPDGGRLSLNYTVPVEG